MGSVVVSVTTARRGPPHHQVRRRVRRLVAGMSAAVAGLDLGGTQRPLPAAAAQDQAHGVQERTPHAA